MALLNFDTDTVELPTYEVLPEGAYEAVITDSRMQTTKSGTGEMLVLTLEVISGDYKGRKLWDRLNLVNPNPTAVALARQTLAHLCLAIGVHQLHDTIELHNRPLLALVRVRKTPDGEHQNEIKGYRPRPDRAVPAPRPATPTPSPEANHACVEPPPRRGEPLPASESTTRVMPWAR